MNDKDALFVRLIEERANALSAFMAKRGEHLSVTEAVRLAILTAAFEPKKTYAG